MDLTHTGMGEQAAADLAYAERNQVVAALARLFPSGIRKTDIEGWDPEWQNCVFIDLPTGQVSWHYHDREAYLFAGLPPYTKPWDGHPTPLKYLRLRALWGHSKPTLFERALIFLGLMDWCASHVWRETNGDQRNIAGARWVCLRCPAKSNVEPDPPGWRVHETH